MEMYMSSSLFKKLYSNIVFGMTMLNKKDHWLLKRIIHELPMFSSVKTMKFENGSLMYGDRNIGNYSADNSQAIVNNQDMIITLKKDNYDIFQNDFINLSKITYFIYCYLFNPFEPKKTFVMSWKKFLNKAQSQKLKTHFNNNAKSMMNLVHAYHNGQKLNEEGSMGSYRKSPPIFANCGIVFDRNGTEFKLMHYTVAKPGNSGHVSVVLIERDGQKYYKLSVTSGSNDTELFRVQNGSEYFILYFNEFTPYAETHEWMSDFSMSLVKGIDPEYDQDVLPNKRYKEVFDMMGY